MPTLPGPLRVNNYAASFPVSGRLPVKPNPLSSVTPVAGGKADMSGIEQALIKRAQRFAKVSFQDNKAVRQSAAGEGEGVGYVVNEDNHLTGTKAFGTLDKYMKKAGLNDFQFQFFGRLIREGHTAAQINTLVKRAGTQFGIEVAAELTTGLSKLANDFLFSEVLSRGAHLA